VMDIILWQSAVAREREKWYLSELTALHQSATPPGELLLPSPRKARWKRTLKLLVGFEVMFLMLAVCMAIWGVIAETRFYSDVVRDIRWNTEKMRADAAQSTDPEKAAKIANSLRNDEELLRKWRLLHVGVLTFIFLGCLTAPVGNLCMTWYLHARPELILLRLGTPVRATVASKKRWLLATRLEMSFTTDRGESIRKKQILREKEASPFQIGGHVWMLHLPRRPKCARLYGLKAALAEVVG
jgi:hypothetical protein